MKKVVITGGGYSGKTKLIKVLSEKGYTIVPEAAIEVITELNEKLGLKAQKKWRISNVVEFQTKIIEKEISLEKSVTTGLVFCDRGIFDCIAYLRFSHQEIPEIIKEIARKYHYDLVFILDTLANFITRRETGRISNKKDSIRQNQLLHQVYSEYGHQIITVPEMDIDKETSIQMRVQYIIKETKKYFGENI